MVNDQRALFPEPDRPGEVPQPRTQGERLRARFAIAVEHGQHPLAVPLRLSIRLHADAPRELRPQSGPRCGDCRHRGPGLHSSSNRRYPKCLFGEGQTTRETAGIAFTYRVKGPRDTGSARTDCRRYWPACEDFEARDSGPDTDTERTDDDG